MSCGCTNKQNNIISKVADIDDKKLSLDQMSNLSIDEITNLYRQGYIIDGLDTLSNIETMPNIKTMAYSDNCSNPSSDIYKPLSQTGGFMIYRGNAFAQKIVPSSRCLDTILFYDVKRSNTVDIHFEIRQDSGGLPSGAPGSPSGRIADITVPYGNIPTTPGYVSVDFLTILPSTGTYWIVVRSSDYVCNTSYTSGANNERIELSRSYTSATERAAYLSSTCSWQSVSGDAFAMEVFTASYTPPTLTSITITPSSASVAVGNTTQLNVSCKDQTNNPITCPTLSWSSNNPSKATVNSSGVVTGVATGTASITCSGGGKTSNASTITVTGGGGQTLTSIVAYPSIVNLGIGSTRQLTAICKDQSNNNMTCPSLTWSSDSPSVATVNPSTGLVTGVAIGTANITCSGGGKISSPSVITVSEHPPQDSGGAGLLVLAAAVIGVAYLAASQK